jgi:hypothetical protein
MVGNGTSNQLYPSVINVSYSMKIIENPQLDNHLTKPDTKVYRYNFDGLTFNTATVRAETKELEQKIKEDINAKIRQEQLTYNDPVVAPEGV